MAVNFLWHNQLAIERCGKLAGVHEKEFCFGSVVPDFVAMGLGRTLRVKDVWERAALSLESQATQRGIDFHYYIDRHYDQIPEANAVRKVMRDHVSKNHPEASRLLSRLMPVLALDLLLDGWLLSQNPDAQTELRETLNIADVSELSQLSTNPYEFERVLHGFRHEIPDYQSNHAIAGVIGSIALRRLNRPLSLLDQEIAARSIQVFRPVVNESAEEIIAAMRHVTSEFALNLT